MDEVCELILHRIPPLHDVMVHQPYRTMRILSDILQIALPDNIVDFVHMLIHLKRDLLSRILNRERMIQLSGLPLKSKTLKACINTQAYVNETLWCKFLQNHQVSQGHILNEINLGRALVHPQLGYISKVLSGYENGHPHVNRWITISPRYAKNLCRALVNPLQPKQLLQLIEDISVAVWALHQNGYLHMDLKPDNIMITEDNRAVLIDFGLSYRQTVQNQSDAYKMTSYYRSPELFGHIHFGMMEASTRMSSHTEMWCLGLTLMDLFCTFTPLSQCDILVDDEKDAITALQGICRLIGCPQESDLLHWGLTAERRTILLKSMQESKSNSSQKDSLYQTQCSIFRNHIKVMNRAWIKAIFKLIERMLQWDPHKRPLVSEYWEDLQAIKCSMGMPICKLPQVRCLTLAKEEVVWRRHMEQQCVESWWNRAEYLCQMYFPTDNWVDVPTLACDLMLRVLYDECTKGTNLYSQADMCSACILLALMVTRPWIDLSDIQERLQKGSQDSLMQIVDYITEALAYILYVDNKVTEGSIQGRAYWNNFKAEYLGHFTRGVTFQ